MKEEIKRGQIYMADLNPVIGSEQGGIRPVVIIQNDMGNRYSPTIIVAAITGQVKKKLPTHIKLNTTGLTKESTALLEQIRTLDAQNIIDDVTYLEQTNDIKKRLNTLRSRRLKLLNEDEEEQCIEKIRQLKSFLMESPKGILWYDDRIFTEIIEKVLVVSKDEIEFELKCGFRFKERIVWN